jgi:hypothetical protein
MTSFGETFDLLGSLLANKPLSTQAARERDRRIAITKRAASSRGNLRDQFIA